MTISIPSIVDLESISSKYNIEKSNLFVKIEMIDEIFVIKETNFIPIKKVVAKIYKIAMEEIIEKELLENITKYFNSEGKITTLEELYK